MYLRYKSNCNSFWNYFRVWSTKTKVNEIFTTWFICMPYKYKYWVSCSTISTLNLHGKINRSLNHSLFYCKEWPSFMWQLYIWLPKLISCSVRLWMLHFTSDLRPLKLIICHDELWHSLTVKETCGQSSSSWILGCCSWSSVWWLHCWP